MHAGPNRSMEFFEHGFISGHRHETAIKVCFLMKPHSIAAILPHLGVFGGIRRYLSLGNEWVQLGHHVTLYTPAGAPPGWMPFAGEVRPWDAIAGAEECDVALTP